MDFLNNAFQAGPSVPKFSEDTMSHANLVAACQWSWTRSPDPNNEAQTTAPGIQALQSAPSSALNNVRTRRFASCQGRLYHQLLCSHRIRTDIVEDCGANCVEPFDVVGAPFICNECVQVEATEVWEVRKTQHNESYPPISQMSKEQYDQYYEERRQLEADFAREHKMYEMELRTRMRPSNICSALEASKEDAEFAAELDSLSLALMASNSSANEQAQLQIPSRGRLSLPNDASEQLHWNLNTLALDRGSCGIEYLTPPSTTRISPVHQSDEDQLWKKPRS